MIIIVKQQHDEKQLNNLVKWIKNQGLGVDLSIGSHSTILGVVGDTSKIDIRLLQDKLLKNGVKLHIENL